MMTGSLSVEEKINMPEHAFATGNIREISSQSLHYTYFPVEGNKIKPQPKKRILFFFI